MDRDLLRNMMWSEACEMIIRAERLHRAFFGLLGPASPLPAWAPPLDILETEREVLVLVALPGVSPDLVDVAIDGDELVLAGVRKPPPELKTAFIHRLELPQGRFERRVLLPAGAYSEIRRSAGDGCLLITLLKAEASGG